MEPVEKLKRISLFVPEVEVKIFKKAAIDKGMTSSNLFRLLLLKYQADEAK